jgi:hypothetical protein
LRRVAGSSASRSAGMPAARPDHDLEILEKPRDR